MALVRLSILVLICSFRNEMAIWWCICWVSRWAFRSWLYMVHPGACTGRYAVPKLQWKAFFYKCIVKLLGLTEEEQVGGAAQNKQLTVAIPKPLNNWKPTCRSSLPSHEFLFEHRAGTQQFSFLFLCWPNLKLFIVPPTQRSEWYLSGPEWWLKDCGLVWFLAFPTLQNFRSHLFYSSGLIIMLQLLQYLYCRASRFNFLRISEE